MLNIAKSHLLNMNLYNKECDIPKQFETPNSNRVNSIKDNENSITNKNIAFTQRIQK